MSEPNAPERISDGALASVIERNRPTSFGVQYQTYAERTAYLMAIELQQRREADRWISVEERLPKSFELVLVESPIDSPWPFCAKLDDMGEWVMPEGFEGPVVYWRALPEGRG